VQCNLEIVNLACVIAGFCAMRFLRLFCSISGFLVLDVLFAAYFNYWFIQFVELQVDCIQLRHPKLKKKRFSFFTFGFGNWIIVVFI